MPAKGNRGNLLQHWTLCRVLEALEASVPAAALTFVDFFAMEPLAALTPTDGTRSDFTRVRDVLASIDDTYAHAWLALAKGSPDLYPNSALFVQHLWPTRPLTVRLVDESDACATMCAAWVEREVGAGRLSAKSVALHMDWRDSVATPIVARTSAVEGAFLLSLDPDVYTLGDRSSKRKINRDDLRLIGRALRPLTGVPVVVQLSTYSADGKNYQKDVRRQVEREMGAFGFVESGTIVADGHMMSMVFTRGVTLQVSTNFPWPKG